MRLYYIWNTGVCPVLTLNNGSVNYSQPLIEEPRGYLAKTRAYFSCDAGYVLSGPSSITCKSDGQAWNLLPPICIEGIKITEYISVMYYKEHGWNTLLWSMSKFVFLLATKGENVLHLWNT